MARLLYGPPFRHPPAQSRPNPQPDIPYVHWMRSGLRVFASQCYHAPSLTSPSQQPLSQYHGQHGFHKSTAHNTNRPAGGTLSTILAPVHGPHLAPPAVVRLCRVGQHLSGTTHAEWERRYDSVLSVPETAVSRLPQEGREPEKATARCGERCGEWRWAVRCSGPHQFWVTSYKPHHITPNHTAPQVLILQQRLVTLHSINTYGYTTTEVGHSTQY